MLNRVVRKVGNRSQKYLLVQLPAGSIQQHWFNRNIQVEVLLTPAKSPLNDNSNSHHVRLQTHWPTFRDSRYVDFHLHEAKFSYHYILLIARPL
jgi:hypothetical protein